MFASPRRLRRTFDIWPGYVDVLSALLMVVIFVLMIFTLAQFFLSETLSDRDAALADLNQRIAELSGLLAVETEENAELGSTVNQMSEMLSSITEERYELFGQVEELTRSAVADKEKIALQMQTIVSLQEDINALRKVRGELETQVGELAAGLRTLTQEAGALRDRSKVLEGRLADERERTLLAQRSIEKRDVRIQELATLIADNERALNDERELRDEARSQVAVLNRQINALREQLVVIAAALQVAEQKSQTQEAEIEDLGRRLNVALARRVSELERYRSEFFGRMRELLADEPNIRVAGDRFVFQSELLFESGSAELGVEGQQELAKLAQTLLQVSERIPADLNWILRVDGHTDRIPIRNERYRSNWELSAARALSVVLFLGQRGIAHERLSAAGFGEFQPVDPGNTPEAYRRNRRIEIKLTTR